MTVFVDYLVKAGTPKQTVVKQAKSQASVDYDPSHDFWKVLRDGIVDMHKHGRPVATLAQLQASIAHPPKLNRYPAAIAGYKKWLGKKKTTWFAPPRGTFSSGGLDISVNPELGLEITTKNGQSQRHVIKLYFKETKPKKQMVEAAIALMAHTLGPKVKSNAEFCLLDVERHTMWCSPIKRNVVPLLHAEAAGFAVMWSMV